MPQRYEKLITGEIYHVCNKSIAGYIIFNTPIEYQRILALLCYYQQDRLIKFSKFNRTEHEIPYEIDQQKRYIEIISYCLMPTHIHLILKQIQDNGISFYMRHVLNGYARYFNIRYRRKGPLWQGRFKNILVERDEQLLHLTRYIHLNPVSAKFVDSPQNWEYSSYLEYMQLPNNNQAYLCSFQDIVNMKPEQYRKFVLDHASYQRELAHIKHLLLE